MSIKGGFLDWFTHCGLGNLIMAVWHQRGLELTKLDVSAVPSLGLRDQRIPRELFFSLSQS